MKQAQKIGVGLHEGRPGFTVEYTDGERTHFIFHRGIAKSLASALNKIVNDLDYMDRQMAGIPRDGVSINDVCQVKLTPPKSLGISGSNDINVSED